jgi:cytochrome c-type biogenesis protein CcmH/NrfG
MEALLQALASPGAMSGQQWLLVAILVFVVIGAAYLVWRLYKLVMTEQKSTYVPNIGRKRLATQREREKRNAGD